MNDYLCGHAWVFGDNVDTDHIIPSRYCSTTDYMEMSSHCFADMRPEFTMKRKDGEILVGGKNFGCGSSRQFAPLVIRNWGISCIIAESFARIFLRNSINMGFPVIELPGALEYITEGDVLEIKMEDGKLVNKTTNKTHEVQKLPEFMGNILNAGGLNNYIQKRMLEGHV